MQNPTDRFQESPVRNFCEILFFLWRFLTEVKHRFASAFQQTFTVNVNFIFNLRHALFMENYLASCLPPMLKQQGTWCVNKN